MNRLLFQIIICALCLFFLTGCTGTENSAYKKNTSDSLSASTGTESLTYNEATNGYDERPLKKYATLNDYLNDPENSQNFVEIKESGGDVLEINVYANGNSLVYNYTYISAIAPDDLPIIKSKLEALLDENEDLFYNLKGTVQSQIDEELIIEVIYHNQDGTIIIDRSF